MQKTSYEMLISDWSSDVFSSDLVLCERRCGHGQQTRAADGRYGEQLPSHVSSSERGWVGRTMSVSDLLLTVGRGRFPPVCRGLRVSDAHTGRETCRDSVCQYV